MNQFDYAERLGYTSVDEVDFSVCPGVDIGETGGSLSDFLRVINCLQ